MSFIFGKKRRKEKEKEKEKKEQKEREDSFILGAAEQGTVGSLHGEGYPSGSVHLVLRI